MKSNHPEPFRLLRDIGAEIARTWPHVNYAAKPYLDAIRQMDRMSDRFGYDDAKDIVLRFLCNASAWRGPDARRIKAELNAMVRSPRA